ncbi:hypothetical protein HPB50_029327 [Hyalomma asiaticum]|nr:hypothetical protein HPB50_029327 [Hyalomma asiaticum]
MSVGDGVLHCPKRFAQPSEPLPLAPGSSVLSGTSVNAESIVGYARSEKRRSKGDELINMPKQIFSHCHVSDLKRIYFRGLNENVCVN